MSLAKTYLQDIRADYPSNLDRDELRVVSHGLLMAVLEMTNAPGSVVSRNLKALADNSQGLALDIPVRKKGLVTIKNVRSCVVQCGQSETDLVRVVWTTVVADICMVPGQYPVNMLGYQEDLAEKIRLVVETFKTEIESDLDTAFDANKTQVYGSTIVGDDYPLVGNAIQVDAANLEYFFGALVAINFADEFKESTIKIVANHRVMPVVDRLFNQGSGNDENTAYQFPGKDFRFSNAITNGAGIKATGYFMPDGSVGLLTRVDVDAKRNHKATKGTEWMEETLPGLPFPVGIKFDSECSDQSALEANGLEHLTATLVQHWQISFDYAIIVPYNSDAAVNAGAIRKFEFI